MGLEWLGAIGAWLLFVGPIYQAMLELRAHEVATKHLWPRERFEIAKVSGWWWLVPPVKIYLERKRGNVVREEYLANLPDETVSSLIDYMNRATGWAFVASGAFLLGLRESVLLLREYAVATWLALLISGAIGLFCIIMALSRFQSIARLSKKRAPDEPRLDG